MKLIVEGPDGGGKTMLIERLGLSRIHSKSLRGGVGGSTEQGWAGVDEAPVAYARRLYRAADNTAFDRFYLSELVYGPLLRGQAAITSEEVTLVHRVERALGIPTVVCLPRFEATRTNVMQEGRERPAYQTTAFLVAAYIAWCSTVDERPGAQTFDYERDRVPTREELLAWVAAADTMPAGMIGSPRAHTLVVTADHHLYLPAFSMRDLAAATLNRALWYAGWREEELAFTNALQASNSSGVKAALPPSIQTVIAVGQEAAYNCHALGIGNGAPDSPLVFTVADPRYTTVTNLAQALKPLRIVTRIVTS